MTEYKSLASVTEGEEWLTRPISMLGTVGGFVAQLSKGADLTKMSLPAVFFLPFSALELGGYRNLRHIDVLLQASRETTSPLLRMIAVIRWYLTNVQRQNFQKKPFNPLLGEQHVCETVHHYGKNNNGPTSAAATDNTDNNNNDDDDDKQKEGDGDSRTSYVGEQVSHHPPVSAYYIENEKESLYLCANVAFGMHFMYNKVEGKNDGWAMLHLPAIHQQNGKEADDEAATTTTQSSSDSADDREVYEFDKPVPDIVVHNVIAGTRRLAWDGASHIVCRAAGFCCRMTFAEEKDEGSAGWFSGPTYTNVVKGCIQVCGEDGLPVKDSEPLATFEGDCGGDIRLEDKRSEDDRQGDPLPPLLLDWSTLRGKECDIQFNANGGSVGDVEMESLRLWAKLNQCIVDDDMKSADKEKHRLETEQRDRRAKRKESNTLHEPRFFKFEPLTAAAKQRNAISWDHEATSTEVDTTELEADDFCDGDVPQESKPVKSLSTGRWIRK